MSDEVRKEVRKEGKKEGRRRMNACLFLYMSKIPTVLAT